MITYWKSNTEKEFRLYGKQSKERYTKLNEAELNKRVTEALAKDASFNMKPDLFKNVSFNMKLDLFKDASFNMKSDLFKNAGLFTKLDFKVKNWEKEWKKGFCKEEPRFIRILVQVDFQVLKNERPKICSESGGLLKNGKTQRFDRDFQRLEKGKLRSWISRVSSKKCKKPKFISGGLPKNRKLKDLSQMGFQKTKKGESLLRFVSILSYES
ncbi:hypothetical protein RhiirA1_457973 [Rhizophagus irregularis]|uniref:Uncharacterized protein n=1 Tax=Rhizophagus irregularis TaxID=588596 RepID=A0A2N0RX04_9GLOM|nr:hypothetical protein RhiirA1_457973 [Rhizophagus irregularis]